MKIIHTGDIHECPTNQDEVDVVMAALLLEAERDRPDAFVFAGDLFESGVLLHSTTTDKAVKHITAFASIAPVLLLQGTFSHDAPGSLNVFKSLHTTHPIFVADRICQVAIILGGNWVQSAGAQFHAIPPGADAVFSCLPTVNKAYIAAMFGVKGVGAAATSYVTDILQGFRHLNRQCRAAEIPAIFVAHGTLNGAITEHGVPMVGFDHEFSQRSIADADFTAGMLAHIHKPQRWDMDDDLIISYCGSPGRYHYGEEGDKVFNRWTFAGARPSLETVTLPARRLIHISFDGPPCFDRLHAESADCSGAHVRVRYSIDEEHRHSVDNDAIRAIFIDCGAADVKIEPRTNPVQRQRAAGISEAPTLADKVKRWCEITDSDPTPLLPRLGMLEHSEQPQDIAARIMNQTEA